MSIGSTNVDFKEIYDAINGAGAHTEAGEPSIGMDSFYDMSFSDDTSTPSSGPIGIGGYPEGTNKISGKTIPYSPDWHPTGTSGKTGDYIDISGQTITSTVNNTRYGVFFTSITEININVTSIKFQAAKGVASENIRFGIGNGDFDDDPPASDPRDKILYSIYFTTWNNEVNPYIYSWDPTTNTQYSANLTPVVPWSSWYNENTIFEIRIDQNNVVSFYKDNVVLWAPGYTIDFTTPKYLMGSMWFINGGVKNVEIT